MRSENKNDLEVLIRKYTASDSVNTMLADIKYILNRRLLDRENRYTHFGVKDEFLAGADRSRQKNNWSNRRRSRYTRILRIKLTNN
jgi:hypothetical protein